MKIIFDVDRRMLLERCAGKTVMVAKVTEHPGWAKLWDHFLDLGWKVVLGLQMLSRAMSHHGRGKQPCQLCEVGMISSLNLEILSKFRSMFHL